MPEWLIRLKGYPFDLEELSDHFTSPERNVQKDEDGYYYLRSSDFEQMDDSEAVRERALELLGYMNGAVKLYSGGSYRAVEFGGVITRIGESGKHQHYLIALDTLELRSTVKPTIIKADGTV